MKVPIFDFSCFFFAGGPQIFATTGDTNFQLIIVDFVSTDLDIAAELKSSRIPRLAIFLCSVSFLLPLPCVPSYKGWLCYDSSVRWKMLTVDEVFSRSQGLQVGIDYVEVSAVLLVAGCSAPVCGATSSCDSVHVRVCVCVCVCVCVGGWVGVWVGVSGVWYAHFHLHCVFHSPRPISLVDGTCGSKVALGFEWSYRLK